MSTPYNEKGVDDNKSQKSTGSSSNSVNRIDNAGNTSSSKAERAIHSEEDSPSNYTLIERQQNPYLGVTENKVLSDVNELCDKYGLDDLREILVRGARYAYSAEAYEERLQPDERERKYIEIDKSTVWKDKWNHTFMMYYVAILCGSAAIVSGYSED